MSNDTRITAFKGFDKNLVCRGYQYELGKTYEHEGKVVRCASGGFHSCEYPLDVFGYYPPAESRYAVVVAHGDVCRKDAEDSKLASGKITIEAEIKVPQLIKSAVDWIMARVDKVNGATASEERSHASNTGSRSAASVSGKDSVAVASGYQGKARACAGSAIVLCYRDDDFKLVHIRAAIAGQDGVKPDTWYRLAADGTFTEVLDDQE